MSIDRGELLREHGLRVTAQRLAVFRAVSDAPHVSADAVVEAVRGEIGWISVQAVYDALAALTEKGLLRRIPPAGAPARRARAPPGEGPPPPYPAGRVPRSLRAPGGGQPPPPHLSRVRAGGGCGLR